MIYIVQLRLHKLSIITGGGHVSSTTCPVGMHKLARVAQQFVSVSAEVVSLGLDQVGRQHCGTVTIEEGQSGGETGSRNAKLDRGGHHPTPGRLTFGDFFAEEIVYQKVVEGRILVKGTLDVAQEN